MRFLTHVLLCVTAAFTTPPPLAGERVTHPELGFQISIPDGFVRDPMRESSPFLKKKSRDIVFAYVRPGEFRGGAPEAVLLVSRLRGVIDQDSHFRPPKSEITVETEKWHGFDIEMARVPEQFGDKKFMNFNAQVPLTPEAIQVTFVAEVQREEELRSLLRTTLATLDGPTNWLTAEERIDRWAFGTAALAISLALLFVLARLAFTMGARRQPEPPSGEQG
jgi:hypothetical protein